jgi:hypothetical protein
LAASGSNKAGIPIILKFVVVSPIPSGIWDSTSNYVITITSTIIPSSPYTSFHTESPSQLLQLNNLRLVSPASILNETSGWFHNANSAG